MAAPVTVAALYVDPAGAYAGLEGVEVWDEARDARLYDGPYPVVAHPPCNRWCRMAGFVEKVYGHKRGDDGGTFAAGLKSVRTHGGVLEHPAHSLAWDHFNLPQPAWREGWNLALDGSAVCYVEQGRYGLPVKKGTWLYAFGIAPSDLPELRWGFTPDRDGDPANQDEWGGMHGWRDSWKRVSDLGLGESRLRGDDFEPGLQYADASHTPPAFRDVLLAMARSASRQRMEGSVSC